MTPLSHTDWIGFRARLVGKDAAFDGLRQHIFRHELTSLSWSFFLRSNAGGTIGESKFHEDGRYESSIRHGDEEWKWELVLDSRGRACGVRVAQFPPLMLTRRKDWGWEMSNAYCVFRSNSYGSSHSAAADFDRSTV